MNNSIRGLYLGRFQPFTNKHLSIVQDVLGFSSGLRLNIGVAGWQGERNKDNFLEGEEAAHVVRLSLVDADLADRVGVLVVELRPELTLEESIRRVVPEKEPTVIFSGSKKTIGAVKRLSKEGIGVRVFELTDDDVTPPRAREVRLSIMEGNGNLHNLLTPSAAEYLINPIFRERILSLPDGGIKRPWSTEVETNLGGCERRY